jgi:prevent-host-death family protein
MTKKTVSLAEAKSRLSELVVRAAYGREEFVITRRGRPAALLTFLRPGEKGRDLADVRGWLPGNNPLFEALAEARRVSRRKGPRVLR